MSSRVISWKPSFAPGFVNGAAIAATSCGARSFIRSPRFPATADGTQSGRPAAVSCVATFPACWSWIATFAPCACTRSASARRPGRNASLGNRELARDAGARRIRDRAHADDDHAGAAARALLVVALDALARVPVRLREVRPHRGQDDAVADLDRTDPARREEMLEGSLRRHSTPLHNFSAPCARVLCCAAASVSCETMRVGIALIESYRFSSDPKELGIGGLAARARCIEELGFDGILSSETAGHDPFFPLLIAAEHTTRVRLATGVAIAFPRAPMVVAQMAWDLQRLSAGRFTLGLGTQVKGHNERRYGVPWPGAPGPRMREYVACLRAIFESFQHPDAPRWFEGEHHRFTMLPPVFAPEPIEHPQIPIHIAAVNPYMSRSGRGELRRGLRASHLYAEIRQRA